MSDLDLTKRVGPLSDAQVKAVASTVLPKVVHDAKVINAVTTSLESTRSLQATLEKLKSHESITTSDYTNLSGVLLLLRLTNHDIELVRAILDTQSVSDPQPLTQGHLASLVFWLPLDNSKVTADKMPAWTHLRRRLFALEPTEAISALISSERLKIPFELRDFVLIFFSQAVSRGFDMARDSVAQFLEHHDVKAAIEAASRFSPSLWPPLRQFLNRIQRLQALVSEPQDLCALFASPFDSAQAVARAGGNAATLMTTMGVSSERAKRIVNHATGIYIRSQGLLAEALKARGSMQSDDGYDAATMDAASTGTTPPSSGREISMSTIFDLESMGCEDCASITSPAAYLVHLLHTLKDVKASRGSSTMLKRLLARRPDLQDLELSCANATVLIPYIDLVNEMLESVVWHVNGDKPGDLPDSKKSDKAISIEAHNMGIHDTVHSISTQPAHVDYRVYSEIVQNSFYPMNVFPYNQAIDSIRTHLKVLHSSRFELLSKLRSPDSLLTDQFLQTELPKMAQKALAAECLGLQHEDYVMICRQGFYNMDLLKAISGPLDAATYTRLIGLGSTWDYWGYQNEAAMVAESTGLALIKGQLLPRSGLAFPDLIGILKTKFFSAGLVIESSIAKPSSNPKVSSIWFTGHLEDMRLRQLGEGGRTRGLDIGVCQKLLCFFKLRSKLQWDVDELDAVLVVIATNQQQNPHPSGFHFTPELLDGLAAVKELAELAGVKPVELQPLWGDMNAHGPASLYSRSFLGGSLSPDERRDFELDKSGNLPPGLKISDHLHSLTSGLRATAESLAAISSAFDLADRLDLTTISLFFRVNLLCRLVGVSAADFGDLLSLFSADFDPFASPRTTLAFVRDMKNLLAGSGSWKLEELLFVVQGRTTAPSSQFYVDNGPVLQLAASIFSGLKAAGLGAEATKLEDGDESKLSQRVERVTAQLFGSQAGRAMADYVNQPPKPNDKAGALLFTIQLATVLGPDEVKKLLKVLSSLKTIVGSARAKEISALVVRLKEVMEKSGKTPSPAGSGDGGAGSEFDTVTDFLRQFVEWFSSLRVILDTKEAGSFFKAFLEIDGIVGSSASKTLLKELSTSKTGAGTEQARLLLDTILDAKAAANRDHARKTLQELMTPYKEIPLEQARTLIKEVEASEYIRTFGDPKGPFVNILDTLKPIDSAAAKDLVSRLSKPVAVLKVLMQTQSAKGLLQSLLKIEGLQILDEARQTLAELEKPKVDGRRSFCFLSAVLPAVPKTRELQIILDNMQPLVPGLDPKTLQSSLSQILQMPAAKVAGEVESAADAVLALTETTDLGGEPLSGFFVPPSAGRYVFTLDGAARSHKIVMDGTELVLDRKGGHDFPYSVTTDPLIAGQHYGLSFDGPPVQLKWTAQEAVDSLPAAFSDETLVPTSAVSVLSQILSKLLRLSVVVTRFKLEMPEMLFWQKTGQFDFNAPTLSHIQTLTLYSRLRREFSGAKQPLYTLYQWLYGQADGSLSEQIAAVTVWPKDLCLSFLVAKYRFPNDRHPALRKAFKDIHALVDMREALRLVDKLGLPGVSLRSLFDMALPPPPPTAGADFRNAAILRLGMQSRFGQSKGAGSGKTPLAAANDELRARRRDALVQWLLAQGYAKDNRLTDADALFGHFLIDVQMGPVMQTSRIVQAISTVQLFVKRCMLGVEKEYGISQSEVAGGNVDWESMLQYRLWEANRKIYFHPENWLDPSLRDDKSDQFKALEAAMLKTRLDRDSIEGLVKGYIHDVNDVADLQIEAYLWDRRSPLVDDDYVATFHFFGRTRTSPPAFYHRQMELSGSDINTVAYWSPWEKVDMDVSVQTTDGNGKKLSRPGSYMVPAKFRGRLFVFLPEISLGQHQSGNTAFKEESFEALSKRKMGEVHADHEWEVRIGYAEYRHGKWSAKKVSDSAISVPADNKTLPDVSSFKFWVQTTGDGDGSVLMVRVERVQANKSQFLGRFEMRGQRLVLHGQGNPSLPTVPGSYERAWSTVPTVFSRFAKSVGANEQAKDSRQIGDGVHEEATPLLGFVEVKTGPTLYSWTMSLDSVNHKAATGFVFDVTTDSTSESYFAFPPGNLYPWEAAEHVYACDLNLNPIAPQLIKTMNESRGLEAVYRALKELPQGWYHDAFGGRNSTVWHERSTPYAIYNWELGVHVPSLLMERLMATQQLDLALEVARLVFDPTAEGEEIGRCWSFPPFRDERVRTGKGTGMRESWRKKMMESEWRASNDNVHAAARGDPATYMKRFVMKYAEILVAAGDEQFRRNSMESLPMAIQRYVEASHVFGAAPVEVPQLGKRAVKTYRQIAQGLDADDNVRMDMELAFPFYSDPGQRGSSSDTDETAKPLGLIRTGYFCVPGNPAMAKLRSLIDDRLYKIRNGLDIDGKQRTLALLAPPIDPGAVARAKAGLGGGGGSGLLAGMDGPMPKYRFRYILQSAYQLVGELKSSQQQLLSIREKKDGEALLALRARHRTKMAQLSVGIQESQRAELAKAMESLEASRRQSEMRLRYYLALTGDKEAVPTQGATWRDIEQVVQTPAATDPYRMSPEEGSEVAKADEAADKYWRASVLNAMAGALFALPTLSTDVQPFGVGMQVSFGGSNLGQISACGAEVLSMYAQRATEEGAQAGRHGVLARQLQERQLRANESGHELMRVDREMEVVRAQMATCEARVRMQREDEESAEAEERWLLNKYTAQSLYGAMDSALGVLYNQGVRMASEMVRTARRALDFEHSLRYPSGVNGAGGNGGGFVDSVATGGHFTAEALFLDLKQLEGMHMDNTPHDLEMVKTVSLRQTDPWALLQLRQTGEAEFDVSEAMLDMDFPGHYCRRIVAVELTLPCVVGAYAGVNCTLSLLSHRYRVSPVSSVEAYDSEEGFRTDRIPITSMVGGTMGQITGRDDERYGPFEGAGAVSRWRIALPSVVRGFDYDGIVDAVLRVRYTAVDGGRGLAGVAEGALVKRLAKHGEGVPNVVAVDLRIDCADEWRAVTEGRGGGGTTGGVIRLSKLKSMMPYWTQRGKVTAGVVSLVVSPESVEGLNGVCVRTDRGGEIKLEKGGAREVKGLLSLGSKGVLDEEVADGWRIEGLAGGMRGAWLVIAYAVSGLSDGRSQ